MKFIHTADVHWGMNPDSDRPWSRERAQAIRDEYAKLGIEVDTSEEDLMRIRGGQAHGARTRSHGDHRMAMSLAVAALRSSSDRY